jgi:hypothetical protein
MKGGFDTAFDDRWVTKLYCLVHRHDGMANTAENETFAVELLSVARDVPITTDELFEDDKKTLSTLLFFAVLNNTERLMRW